MRNHATNGATIRRPLAGRFWDNEKRATRITDVSAFQGESKVQWRQWRGAAPPKGDWPDARGKRSDKSKALRRFYKREAGRQLSEYRSEI